MPFYYYYGYDPTYLYFLLPCLLIATIASLRVNSTFRKYSKQLSMRGITGAEAAKRVLAFQGVNHVEVQRVNGNLTDHYDPKKNVIRLSESVYDSTSTAAIGVACHEAGHAVQYAKHYGPIKLRAAIIPITNIGSKLALPLILIGFLMESLGAVSYIFIDLGILCFSLSLIFQLITLPVEFNASRRALRTINDLNLLSEDECIGARKTLRAAAMTYVASTLVAAAQVLRLFLLFGRRRKN